MREYQYIENLGWIPKYWEDNLPSGTDEFSKRNDGVVRKIKLKRKIIKSFEKDEKDNSNI